MRATIMHKAHDVRVEAARTGRNPRTGKVEDHSLKFSPADALKAAATQTWGKRARQHVETAISLILQRVPFRW